MEVHFSKFHGAGNDFIAIDNRDRSLNLTVKQRKDLCHRKFGLGADGVLELQTSETADFKLVYHKANGAVGTLCGNGSRCAMAFARYVGVRFGDEKRISFEAYDGVYYGAVKEGGSSAGSCGEYTLCLKDIPLSSVRKYANADYFMDNGSPHHVIFTDGDLENVDVFTIGSNLRYNVYDSIGGCNINFATTSKGEDKNSSLPLAQENDNKAASDLENLTLDALNRQEENKKSAKVLHKSLMSRTYERGVEGETLACGTGSVAVAIADFVRCAEKSPPSKLIYDAMRLLKETKTCDLDGSNLTEGKVITKVQMPGGLLTVTFDVEVQNMPENGRRPVVLTNVQLSGPAQHVFDGVCRLSTIARNTT
ncbi:diaminopimelate epimerase [Aplysia californica]|uniref:Diaminopimelate epimerase n=1 Tax=Aplysia californica TaxID=6500 RepID=A0ABM0JUA8_APLCA|nr:diaminopimelate epimerase [Aplysia californica]